MDSSADSWSESDRLNPARRFAFWTVLALVFLRFSFAHEMLTHFTGVNLYPLYLFGLPASLGVFLTGGVRRTFQGRPAYYWMLFAVWVVVCTPFSIWKGGSIHVISIYFKANLVMLFAVAGLTFTWAECKLLMAAGASGAMVNVLSGRLFDTRAGGERLSLEFGAIANSNDYSAHLMFVLPFVLWMVLNRGLNKLMRFLAVLVIAAGILSILRTGSRGAAVALGVDFLLIFIGASAVQRMATLFLAPLLFALLLPFVPHATLNRITSFSRSEEGASAEALESSEIRGYLLRMSITTTFKHPLFGVGPGQFSTYEGLNGTYFFEHGSWRQAHNTFSQISSECGIPGFIFFLGGILSSFNLLRKTYKEARARPNCKDIAVVTFCLMLSLAGFCSAVFFLTFGYYFYLPTMAAISIAVTRASRQEFQARYAPEELLVSSFVSWNRPLSGASHTAGVIMCGKRGMHSLKGVADKRLSCSPVGSQSDFVTGRKLSNGDLTCGGRFVNWRRPEHSQRQTVNEDRGSVQPSVGWRLP
jgi:hypothetical protein